MIYNLLAANGMGGTGLLLGVILAFFETIFLTGGLCEKLPRDGGRDFAHDGKKSAGKPRGAGIIFVLVYAITALLFAPVNLEIGLYVLLVVICMITGFLDDAAKTPWGEYLKGFLDLCVAVAVAVVYIMNHGSTVHLALFGVEFKLPAIVYGILAVILVWASINVTNCTDGVDGLSGSLAMITMMSIYFVMQKMGAGMELSEGQLAFDFAPHIPMMAICILAYLWYNATPSKLMMGDAGSRAMGIFIAIAVLQTGAPLLYLILGLVMILDGGLGLIKVSLIRFCKLHIMKNIRTPLHDHVRKNWEWSNTQCVFRFAIIQIILCVIVVYLMK